MKSNSRAGTWTAGGLTLGLLFCASALAAQTDPLITRSLFTWRDAALAGGFVAATLAIRPLDLSAESALQKPARQQNRVFRKAAITFKTIAAPGSLVIGVSMYATGRLGHEDRLAELGLLGTEALLVGEGVGTVLKNFFGRARPFADSVPNPDNWQLMRGFTSTDKYRSFPSGHTVAGFAAAAAVTAETSRWWPGKTWLIAPVMYGGASLVGLARMYENRHWASDVILGAAIGTFAGMKIVRYHRNHPDNRVDRFLLNASVSPSDLRHVSISLIPLLH